MTLTRCAFFETLERRIATLREKFILDQIAAEASDPVSFQADLDRLAAFRLLVHAEFEEFLETKATQGIDQLEADFRAGVKAMRANPLAFVIGAVLARSDERLTKVSIDEWDMYFEAVIRAARKFISDNNGIKESSFRNLSIFSGKMPDELDTALALGLNNYGKSRGDVAHKSAARVRTLRAPSAEASEVDSLLKNLGTFFA